jgi:hypothetical protein
MKMASSSSGASGLLALSAISSEFLADTILALLPGAGHVS